ncbi:MAG: hypothetical protein O7D91_18750 [Planctomycetota bacterium]|nr:hypothetical protein [Planctomycetota bacterium]
MIAQNTTDILAIDTDALQAIAAVIFMLLAGLGGLLKKKAKPREDGGKTIIIPPSGADKSAPAGPRPARPVARPAQAPRPQRTAAAPALRPTPIAPQGRQPLARPTPVARQRPPQARPTPIQQPAQPRRRMGEPARPGPAPQRSDRVARPGIAQQPRAVRRPAVQSERQTHRVRAAEHAEAVADHAEHVASSLREQQMGKLGELELGEHFYKDESLRTRPRHPLLARLNPQNMRDAILLSEIIQPPLALRNEQSSGWF